MAKKGLVKEKGPSVGEAEGHLTRGKEMAARHDYDGALKECQAALSASGGKPPGDEALFCLSRVYNDPQNPKKDLAKSIALLQTLPRDYPQSGWVGSARIWVENLKEQERLKRVLSESLQENEKLRKIWNDGMQENDRLKKRVNEVSQENAKLKKIVEQTMTVDVEMDEKKRNQSK